VFLTRKALQPYFDQGVPKVVVSAPVKDEARPVLNIVYGVNHVSWPYSKLVVRSTNIWQQLRGRCLLLARGAAPCFFAVRATTALCNAQECPVRHASSKKRA